MSKITLIFAALALILTGCAGEIKSYQGGPVGGVCVKYMASGWTGAETPQDAVCRDGSTPRLQYLQWITESGSCEPTQSVDIRGGKAGIRRVFGCGK